MRSFRAYLFLTLTWMLLGCGGEGGILDPEPEPTPGVQIASIGSVTCTRRDPVTFNCAALIKFDAVLDGASGGVVDAAATGTPFGTLEGNASGALDNKVRVLGAMDGCESEAGIDTEVDVDVVTDDGVHYGDTQLLETRITCIEF